MSKTTKKPERARKGGGSPTFCWHCHKQLQRAPGRGLFFYWVVRAEDDHEHRVHGDCVERCIADMPNRRSLVP